MRKQVVRGLTGGVATGTETFDLDQGELSILGSLSVLQSTQMTRDGYVEQRRNATSKRVSSGRWRANEFAEGIVTDNPRSSWHRRLRVDTVSSRKTRSSVYRPVLYRRRGESNRGRISRNSFKLRMSAQGQAYRLNICIVREVLIPHQMISLPASRYLPASCSASFRQALSCQNVQCRKWQPVDIRNIANTKISTVILPFLQTPRMQAYKRRRGRRLTS